MKENNIYDIVTNIILILRERTSVVVFFVSLILFFGLFAFFYGLFTIPTPNGALGFYRMETMSSFEVFYMIFSMVASALIVMVTVYSAKVKDTAKSDIEGRSASVAGVATGVFGAVCPACLGINFLAFGNVFTAQLAFLIPYIFWIQMGGIILLSAGLYLVAKTAYEKKCISCSVDGTGGQSLEQEGGDDAVSKKFIALALITALIFAYQLVAVFGVSAHGGVGSQNGILITDKGEKINIDDIIEQVTPKVGFETTVKWNGIVAKMIETGVLVPDKLENILTKRYDQEMRPEWRAVLAGQDAKLSINSENAVFMMYILWTFAKHNENEILTNSPFAKYFTEYDIDVGQVGYGDTPLLSFTSSQQAIIKRVSENAYRPCCGNSTAAPDCSHGYSALGLVQLMASQGFSEKEIFETFVQFNSFWFPETYIKNALYFKITEGKDWNEVDKELVSGAQYSSLKGSYTAKNYLKNNFDI